MIFMFFVDGLGIGRREDSNPLHVGDFPFFQRIFRDNTVYMDARLGVDGVPQSATGQTSIFTGYNAAAFLGAHKEGFPGSRLGGLIKKESLFKKLMDGGKHPTFANGYITDDLELLAKQRFLSVTTLMTITTEKKVRGPEKIAGGKAVFHDITNETLASGEVFSGRRVALLKRFGYDTDNEELLSVKKISPEKAAENLMGLGRRHDLVLFEFFRTDKAGHLMDMEFALHVLKNLERLIEHLAYKTDMRKHTVIICSDHGNIEDLTQPGHTRNPVPFTVLGKGARSLRNLRSLTDITPALMENIHYLL